MCVWGSTLIWLQSQGLCSKSPKNNCKINISITLINNNLFFQFFKEIQYEKLTYNSSSQ